MDVVTLALAKKYSEKIMQGGDEQWFRDKVSDLLIEKHVLVEKEVKDEENPDSPAQTEVVKNVDGLVYISTDADEQIKEGYSVMIAPDEDQVCEIAATDQEQEENQYYLPTVGYVIEEILGNETVINAIAEAVAQKLSE